MPHCVCVQVLDLGCNRLATVFDIRAAIVLPSLQRLVLRGNPVAARSTVFTKAFNVGFSLQCVSVHMHHVIRGAHALQECICTCLQFGDAHAVQNAYMLVPAVRRCTCTQNCIGLQGVDAFACMHWWRTCNTAIHHIVPHAPCASCSAKMHLHLLASQAQNNLSAL